MSLRRLFEVPYNFFFGALSEKPKEFDLSDSADFGFKDIMDDTDEFNEKKTSDSKGSQSLVMELKKEDELGMRAFNDLFYELKKEFAQYKVDEGRLDLKKDEDIVQFDLDYFVIERDTAIPEKKAIEKRRFVYFNLTKDADTTSNEQLLLSVSSVLNAFQSEKIESTPEGNSQRNGVDLLDKASSMLSSILFPINSSKNINLRKDNDYLNAIEFLRVEKAKKSIFVIPVRQCRGFFYNPIFKAAHIVLAIYDSGNNWLEVHDSQGGIRISNPFTYDIQVVSIPYAYPDKFKELSHIRYTGIKNHKLQLYAHMCGYYVHTWMTLIGRTGDLDLLNKVFLRPYMIVSQEHYLKNWSSITRKVLEAARHLKFVEARQSVFNAKSFGSTGLSVFSLNGKDSEIQSKEIEKTNTNPTLGS